MAESNATVPANGLGMASVLGIVFVVLKLLGVITWPWIWVLAPFWISFLLSVFVFLVVFSIGLWYATRK